MTVPIGATGRSGQKTRVSELPSTQLGSCADEMMSGNAPSSWPDLVTAIGNMFHKGAPYDVPLLLNHTLNGAANGYHKPIR